jgi:tRNA pseudouridine38-40 synthase
MRTLSFAAIRSPPACALESDPPASGPDTQINWALLLEYDGGPFVGWQQQDSGLSVQEVVEAAAARLTGGNRVAATVAGRTDSGVHASGQVVSLALPARFTPRQVRDALNYHMKPHPVVVVRAALAPEGWNPRFSAIGRSYRYVILNRRARPALLSGRAWHVATPLNADAMHTAAQSLLGTHDFTSFRAAACQAKSPVRTLDRLDIAREGDTITMEVEARSFLHHQVRNLAGTLRLVGDGKWPAERVAAVLEARDRSAAGPTAPAEGLCLMRVRYKVDPFWLAPDNGVL